MDKTKQEITNEELYEAFVGEKKAKKLSAKHPADGGSKKWNIMLAGGIVSLVAGVACLVVAFLGINSDRAALNYPTIPSEEKKDATYSALTGEPLANAELVNAPAYCIQTPNGTDGARPQAGLNEAGVVFEAIAESGITRFAAIYQNPTAAVIGPIRSLRIYYLEWDTPFDCTIVHAGGSGDALAAVSSGYKNLDENYNYMYRGTYGGRLWNNLFTTAAYLKKFSTDNGYTTSDIKGFARLTPTESDAQRADESVKEKLDITKPAKGDTSEVAVPVPEIALTLGSWASYNVVYNYDAESNTYLRSYGNGDAHEVYNCAADDLGEKNPEDVCSLAQVAPSVVVAMVVQESRASDNYHEDIAAIGSGDAYIFQNGTVIKGTWKKPSKADQIKFTDTDGEEIKLAPGQTFVTAVPTYGGVDY